MKLNDIYHKKEMEKKFLKQIDNVVTSSQKLGLNLPENLLVEIAEHLGPSIYEVDSKFVNTSDINEIQLVKNEFLIKELNLSESQSDILLDQVIEITKPLKNKKNRILFYALLKDLSQGDDSTQLNQTKIESLSCWEKIKKFLFG
jgi:hypothetical protein